jgi:hypothetical protein
MQTKFGRLREHLESPTYEMTLISNLRSLKVEHEDWHGGSIYIPLERFDNFTPDPEATVRKT